MKSKVTLLDEIRLAYEHKERRSRDLFREHATRVAFQVQLTKHHVRMLLWLWERKKLNQMPREDGVPDQFISSCRALENRGLIVHYYAEDKSHGTMTQRTSKNARSKELSQANDAIGYWRLTRAGLLVAELCAMCQGGFSA